jgi:hypothetical protein
MNISEEAVFSAAEIQNHRSKSSLFSEQFGIEFEVSLESAFLGLSRRNTGFFPPISFGSSTKSRDESVILNDLLPIKHRWNSMHSDQHQPQMSNSIFLV